MTQTEKKANPIVVTKPCPRCSGSGEHSFNLKDGTRCYGCGGKGVVPCTPKGQKKIKPTCDDHRKANAGDIVSIQCVLYRVVRREWIEYIPAKGVMGTARNQRLVTIRLVDDEECSFKIETFGPDIFNHCHGPSGIRMDDGSVYPGCTNIKTPFEWIGKTVEETEGMEVSITYWIAQDGMDAFLAGIAEQSSELRAEVDDKPVQGWKGGFDGSMPVVLHAVSLTGTFKAVDGLRNFSHLS